MFCKMERLSALNQTHICGVVQIIALFQLIGSLFADYKLQEQALSFAKNWSKCNLVGTGMI